MEHFTNTIDLYKKLFRIEPEIIAHDTHPEYLATKYASIPEITIIGTAMAEATG
jgi:hydrogenase maturation protein HypF